jgi:hypothetical protein
MTLFHKIMVKLNRYRLIPDRTTGEDYIHRYYIFLKDRSWFPFNVTLHKIVKSDIPVLHDHPWGFVTIILKGGYWEHTPVFNHEGKMITTFQTWRGPGSIIKHKANDFHWLELPYDKPATTLFFMGPQRRVWGFLKNNKWVQHETFLNKTN